MASVVVVTGSARPNSVNHKVVELTKAQLEAKGAEVVVADVAALGLPFFDAPVPPSSPDFVPEHDSVKQWTQLVADADGVVFVTPEYNHNMSAIQKNAIDWIGKEWEGKRIALVGYGWTSGTHQAHAAARESLAANLKAEVLDTATNLFFMKDLQPDGTPVDEQAVTAKLGETLDELLAKIA